MAAILVAWIANSLAIWIVAYLMRGVEVASFRDALIVGAVLSHQRARQARARHPHAAADGADARHLLFLRLGILSLARLGVRTPGS